ncbi:MAG TPA: zinc dependent phospholipase C family protein [candidate division Zixibacteria bacterium]|nr:zinc dependent phospholipase C family protein [candidate division Zixibacteria bacterium]
MYFLAHMYSLMKSLPIGISLENILEPMILGCWSPDAGYFPHYSPELTKFSHTNNPPINLYGKTGIKARCFEIGWLTHIACDELVHKEIFFSNGDPLCPLIIRNMGFKKLLTSSKIHLGREIGLDVLLFQKINYWDWIGQILFSKTTYTRQKINFPGFKKIQNYVYNYVTKFLPIVNHDSSFSKVIKKVIDYDFYNNQFLKEGIELIITKSQSICRSIIEENLPKEIHKTTTKKRKDF